MKREIPKSAQAQHELILAKLLDLLARAPEHTSARSEYMDYEGSTGGQVLESEPKIKHDYHEFIKMYRDLFAKAEAEGTKLREIETRFWRDPNRVWSHETRWISVAEYQAFVASIAPFVEELRVALRRIAQDLQTDWYRTSLDQREDKSWKFVVRYGSKQRVEPEVTPELLRLAQHVVATAEAQGLTFTGGGWDVEADMEDEPGAIESALGVIGPPAERP